MIVEEFACITKRLQIMYCYSLIRNTTVSQQRGSSDLLLFKRLDTFFPFDPLPLHRAREYIDGIYNEWTGNQEEETEQGEDLDSGDDGEHDPEDIEMDIALSSFNTMSLSLGSDDRMVLSPV